MVSPNLKRLSVTKILFLARLFNYTTVCFAVILILHHFFSTP